MDATHSPLNGPPSVQTEAHAYLEILRAVVRQARLVPVFQHFFVAVELGDDLQIAHKSVVSQLVHSGDTAKIHYLRFSRRARRGLLPRSLHTTHGGLLCLRISRRLHLHIQLVSDPPQNDEGVSKILVHLPAPVVHSAVNYLRYCVYEHQHVIGEVVVNVVEVMDVAEADDGVDTHPGQQGIHRSLLVTLACLQVGTDDFPPCLSEAYAQKARNLLDCVFKQPGLPLTSRVGVVLESHWLQWILGHRVHHVHHALDGPDNHVLRVSSEDQTAYHQQHGDEECGEGAVQCVVIFQVLETEHRRGHIDAVLIGVRLLGLRTQCINLFHVLGRGEPAEGAAVGWGHG